MPQGQGRGGDQQCDGARGEYHDGHRGNRMRKHAPAAAPAGTFAIDKVPVSNAPLGAFPYIGLPDGYKWGSYQSSPDKGEIRDFDHFTFWTGSALHDVEGRLFMAAITNKAGKTYSAYELKKNIEAVIAEAGGVKVTESRIPREMQKHFPKM
jgi:hypothetical protein